MRIVVQRVKKASVEVARELVGEIGRGILVLLGVNKTDTIQDAEFLATKISNLRIFPDDAGKMNRSVAEAGGGVLVVSQFTLYGDCSRGRRPSFDEAASPDAARPLYEYFVQQLQHHNLQVSTGVFQAHMDITLINDGPVTFILDSRR
jgi:D-tyrosyl-tRNA(Tyr) deacylase